MNFKSSLLLGGSLFSSLFFSQTSIPYYASVANQVTQNNITNNLIEFQNVGIKTTGSAKLNEAFLWLKNKYTSFGYQANQISEQSFTYQGSTSKNLIITKTGTKYPNTYVIICGHYDTLNGPGTNDNGSGVSVILEMARLLKDLETDYSIKFINFAGEEQGLIGSSYYVKNIVNGTSPKMDIKMVFNIDEVGGVANQTNNEIMCERDENNSPSTNNAASASVTQNLMTYVGYYSPLQPKLSSAYASDYMPFQNNGEVITGFYEGRESKQPHTPNDTLANMDPIYVYNVAKAATGATLHFASAKILNLSVQAAKAEDFNFSIASDATGESILIDFTNKNSKNFEFSILDLSGKTIKQLKNTTQISTNSLQKGIYLGLLTVDGITVSKKFVID